MLRVLYYTTDQKQKKTIELPSMYKTNRIAGVDSVGFYGTWKENTVDIEFLEDDLKRKPLEEERITIAIMFIENLMSGDMADEDIKKLFDYSSRKNGITMSSYGWKHIVERWHKIFKNEYVYIANGEFIVAVFKLYRESKYNDRIKLTQLTQLNPRITLKVNTTSTKRA